MAVSSSSEIRRLLRFGAGSLAVLASVALLPAQSAKPPAPLLKSGQGVDWWFVFKFNAGSFPGCGSGAQRGCLFGGTVQAYPQGFSQQFAYASSSDPALRQGGGCAGDTKGDTTIDPVGATFDQIYNGNLFYVVWNDQFHGDPMEDKDGPAGHSKGILAWNQDGNGFVVQTSTPSWPASGNSKTPRKKDGNTLGCIKDGNVLVSQHFFSVKLNKEDVLLVLKAMANASVVTDPANPQIVNIGTGGPADIQAVVKSLGKVSPSRSTTKDRLSSGVWLISKPSNLKVPPWQMVSALLGGEPLRAATWWASPKISSTTAVAPGCWDTSLGKPGAVEIATSGTWNGKTIGFEGIPDPGGNHAKVGVSTGSHTYAIFGDMNQQGALSGSNCSSSQNGRGGLFYVVDDPQLFSGVRDLIKGGAAP